MYPQFPSRYPKKYPQTPPDDHGRRRTHADSSGRFLEEKKKKLEKEFEERLKEARSARDDALDNNELLKRTNQELSSRLQEASEKNNELHVANENFKEELNKKNFEIGMLQERVKAQETSIKDLKGAFDTIANK